jgi:hypothetical protein
MAVYICIEDIRQDVLYILFCGWNCTKLTESGRIPYKSWSLHIYTSLKGRHLGMMRQKREYVDCDFLTVDIKVGDLFSQAKTETIIPKELTYVEGDVTAFIKSKIK